MGSYFTIRYCGRSGVWLMLLVALTLVACERNRYEVIGRSEQEVPNYRAPGTHMEVEYVLLHEGHKIYATCDIADLGNLDPQATCGFRPLRVYPCELGPDGSLANQALPVSDLKCKDADGHNVYFYVRKKDWERRVRG